MYDHTVEIIQIYTTITAMSLQSLLAICVSSCHATASISLLSKFCNSHEVKAIHESFCLHHVAKAFIHDSFIIAIFGICSHLEIHKFSTILYISGLSFLVIGLAPESQNITSFCKAKETTHQIPNPNIINGIYHNVIFHHSANLSTAQSVKNNDNTIHKIKIKETGKRTNNNSVFL